MVVATKANILAGLYTTALAAAGYPAGLYATSASRLAYEPETLRCKNFKIAVFRRFVDKETRGTLRKKGFRGMIYGHAYNVGLIVFGGNHTPDLRMLSKHCPGWYIRDNILLCYGTENDVKETPPPRGGPQNVDQLVDLVRRYYPDG